MEILIALDLPADIDKLVDKKRVVYYPQIIGKLEPHITLREPSRVLTDFKIIENKLKDICSKSSPIKIEIDGLDHFGKKAIYWKILNNQKLEQLNKEIVQQLKFDLIDKGKSHQFVPHITIMSRAKEKQFDEVWQTLAKESYHPKYEFICNTLMVMENVDNNPGWEKRKSFTLGGT